MSGDEERSLRLARATMVALFASAKLPANLSPETLVVWLPEKRMVSMDAALLELARFPTSVACIGIAVRQFLNIGVWTGLPTDTFADDILGLVRQLVEDQWPGESLEQIQVLVRSGPGDTADLTWDEFCTWHRHYRFPLTEMHVGVDPDSPPGVRRLSAIFVPTNYGGTMAGGDLLAE